MAKVHRSFIFEQFARRKLVDNSLLASRLHTVLTERDAMSNVHGDDEITLSRLLAGDGAAAEPFGGSEVFAKQRCGGRKELDRDAC